MALLLIRKTCPEHGSFTLRLFFGRFILNDVPMLDKDSVLNAQNICGNRIHRSAETAKSSVHDDEVSLSHDRSRLIPQGWRRAPDEIEKAIAARCDMSAVLNVVRRPITFGRRVVALIKQRVKSFKDKRLVFGFCSPTHFLLSIACSNDLPQSFEPPSTRTVSPVIQRASSDARKATTPPMSSGWAIRFRACMPRMRLRPTSVLAKLDISVSTTPGATALTRMPRSPSAKAKCVTNVATAPLVAP